MAALESLNFDVDGAVHYIHCVLFNIPRELSISEAAPMVVPDQSSELVKQLESAGCRIIPHSLQFYKEPLSTKFGFITFFIRQTSPPSSSVEEEEETTLTPEKVHDMATTWIRQDLTSQLAPLGVKVQLGQPSECYSSIPFLRALHQQCSFLDADSVKNTKMLETFLLTKVTFVDQSRGSYESETSGRGEESSGNCNRDESWIKVGTFRLSSLGSKELLWLSYQHRRFPPIRVMNNNFSNATCDQKALHSFFENALNPIVEVVP